MRDKMEPLPEGEWVRYADAAALVAAERERCLTGYREIADATDSQMRDGDFAREVAARMLGA
jgi:hypothetical protein